MITKYEKLNNFKWLKDLYVNQGLSTRAIADIIGAKTENSVRQALIRFNIKVRDRSEAQTIGREDDYLIINKSIIEGSLLGDASLKCFSKDSEISKPTFCKRNIHYDHIFFVASQLFKKYPEKRIFTEENSFLIKSLTNNKLVPFYKAWYPKENDYKKVIPESIEINNELLLHWFLDDGSSYHRRKHSKIKQIKIILSSECFSRDNQEMLCEKINKKFGLKMNTNVCNSGVGWRIVVPQSKSNLFYEIIGSPPIESLVYKWK